jgi:hypothetical protein
MSRSYCVSNKILWFSRNAYRKDLANFLKLSEIAGKTVYVNALALFRAALIFQHTVANPKVTPMHKFAVHYPRPFGESFQKRVQIISRKMRRHQPLAVKLKFTDQREQFPPSW